MKGKHLTRKNLNFTLKKEQKVQLWYTGKNTALFNLTTNGEQHDITFESPKINEGLSQLANYPFLLR